MGRNVEKKKMSVRLSMQSSKKDMVVRETFHLFEMSIKETSLNTRAALHMSILES